MAAVQGMVPRRIMPVLLERLVDEPVIALQGPRSVGKSTLLREIAAAHDREVIDLDDLGTRDAVRADPALYVGGDSPVFIDEFQHVPAVLDAIKAELNQDLRPGRFVITGSTRYDALPIVAQALTGRLHLVTVWPLSQGEINRQNESFADALVSNPGRLLSRDRSDTARQEYAERVLRGGFPLPLARGSVAARRRWYNDYVALVIERDVQQLERIRRRGQLRAVLARLAAQTAQVVNVAGVARDVGLDPATTEEYVRLLEAVFLVHRLPAWGRSLRTRVVAKPKVHLVDSGLAAHLMGVNADRLLRLDSAALSEFGHIMETFCVAEILKQLAWLDEPVSLGHWRTYDGDEVDLVIERSDGTIAAVEVKVSGRADAGAFRGLRTLRDSMGDAFAGGIVLFGGERGYTFEDRLHAVPIDRLWTA